MVRFLRFTKAFSQVVKAAGKVMFKVFEYISRKLFRSTASSHYSAKNPTAHRGLSNGSRFLPDETVASIYGSPTHDNPIPLTPASNRGSPRFYPRTPDVRTRPSGSLWGSHGSGHSSRTGSGGSKSSNRGRSSGHGSRSLHRSRGGSSEGSERSLRSAIRTNTGYWSTRFNSRMELEGRASRIPPSPGGRSTRASPSPSHYIPWNDNEPDSKRQLFTTLTDIENMEEQD